MNTQIPDDFEAETRLHIAEVAGRLEAICQELRRRAAAHDQSKFSDAEKVIYAKVVPKLKMLPWRTSEYSRIAAELGPALDHHYRNNSHHPEHYPGGISGMDLIDIIEMYCDWAAATLRPGNGDMARTLTINAARYGLAGPLKDLLWNKWQRFGGFSGGPGANLSIQEKASKMGRHTNPAGAL